MSDGLLSAIMDSRYSAKENPWGIAAQSLAANTGRIVNPYGSTGSNAASTIGAALLAGLLGGVARYQTQEDNARIQPMIEQMMTASPEQRADLVAQDRQLSGLAAALAANDMQQQAALAQKRQELTLGRESDLLKAPLLAAAENDALLARQKLLSPGEIKKAAEIARVEAAARKSIDDPATTPDGLVGVPKDLRDDAVKELQAQNKKENVSSFITEQFARAKQLSSVGAMVPFSQANKEFDGINVSLTTALQAALGREMNAKEQERLAQATPQRSDTKQMLDIKEKRFMELMRTISPGRAITNPQSLTPAQRAAAAKTENSLPDPLGIR